MKINRLIAIVVMLLNRKKISAGELAEKFEVSVRTIYRDIEAINMSGIPIASQSGNNGGFYIVDNYKINHQFLTLDDMISIVEALRNINEVLNDKNVDLAIEKVKNIVPDEKKSDFKGFGWYLFSFCNLRQDYRIFKLSRMDTLSILNEEIHKGRISYEKYLSMNKVEKLPTELTLKFSEKVRYRVEDSFDKDEMTFEEDGSIIVNTKFLENEWIYSMILGYGEYVEVIKPLHVREIIKNRCKKMNGIYEKQN